jgi:hypothetical protein
MSLSSPRHFYHTAGVCWRSTRTYDIWEVPESVAPDQERVFARGSLPKLSTCLRLLALSVLLWLSLVWFISICIWVFVPFFEVNAPFSTVNRNCGQIVFGDLFLFLGAAFFLPPIILFNCVPQKLDYLKDAIALFPAQRQRTRTYGRTFVTTADATNR